MAQHSVLVSRVVGEREPEHRLAALLHDATEAYLGDVTSPLKKLLPEYRAIEQRVETVILTRFGLAPIIKQADLLLLASEQRYLMPAHADEWAMTAGIEPLPAAKARSWYLDAPLAPQAAREFFMAEYRAILDEMSAGLRVAESR